MLASEKQSFSHESKTSLLSPPNSNQTEKDLKVDDRILKVMMEGGNKYIPPFSQFFDGIQKRTNVQIGFGSFKDRQKNAIPIISVKSSNAKNLEAACALIMDVLDPHRGKMTFNIDVPFIDHSFIIGKDGSRIKQLSRETRCHIHLPDCNKTSENKSNKLSIAGTSFDSIEKARNHIRKSLPLCISFRVKIDCTRFVYIDTSSSEVQSIKRKYKVDVTFTNVSNESNHTGVTINVKGGRSQMEEIKLATRHLYTFLTGKQIENDPNVDFFIAIDISNVHHQFIRGKADCNLKVIHQRTGASILFPLAGGDINQVLVQSKDLYSAVMGWQELMGYLPLLLSFDVNFNISVLMNEIQKIEKIFGVGIKIREKFAAHVYTVLIKTQERHSLSLNDIRNKILALRSKATMPSPFSNPFSSIRQVRERLFSQGTSYLANTFQPVHNLGNHVIDTFTNQYKNISQVPSLVQQPLQTLSNSAFWQFGKQEWNLFSMVRQTDSLPRSTPTTSAGGFEAQHSSPSLSNLKSIPSDGVKPPDACQLYKLWNEWKFQSQSLQDSNEMNLSFSRYIHRDSPSKSAKAINSPLSL